MNVGLYQSASALTALERWQDLVSQNITSSQQTAYRKRTVSFSSQAAGEIESGSKKRIGGAGAMPSLFPKANAAVSFMIGDMQPTRSALDVAIQGDGFFQLQHPGGSKVYTRNGEFHTRDDRTLVSATGEEVMSTSGTPITMLPNGGSVTINQDGTVVQGTTSLGKLAVMKFASNAQLTPVSSGSFVSAAGSPEPESVDQPGLLQGYLEGSNSSPLREMVDLVMISRAYEANQKIITTVDQEMQKTFDALG